MAVASTLTISPAGPTAHRKRMFGCASSPTEVHAIKVYDGNSKRRRLRSYGISIAREAHMAKKAAAKKSAGRKKAAKRELIDTRRDKRYVRRRAKGRFKESDDVGKSLAQDRRTKAKTKVKIGQGDKGDR